MVFVPYESDTATITITNAAGIVTYNNGATESHIETRDELPVRGGSLDSQLEAFLEARFGNATFCDCGDHTPWYSVTLNKLNLTFIPSTGLTGKFVRISAHALWPQELTESVLNEVAQLEQDSAVTFQTISNGLGVYIDVACGIFTGQNIELGLTELLTVRKQLKDTYKSRGKSQ